jgi:hypothetical protein
MGRNLYRSIIADPFQWSKIASRRLDATQSAARKLRSPLREDASPRCAVIERAGS